MSTAFGKFKVYPRGFLGKTLEPTMLRKAVPSTTLQYDVTVFDPKEEKSVIANMALAELYAQMIRREHLTDLFDFREKALLQILAAFGTNDFVEWYLAQYQSPAFGETHSDFLDDCLGFIMTGRRKLPLQTWAELVTATDDSLIGQVKLPENAKAFFNRKQLSELTRGDSYYQLPRIVQDWMAKPGGFSDLLQSCHLFFGLQ